jgi:hypothetical protein
MNRHERARHEPGTGVDVGPVGAHSTAHLNLTKPLARVRFDPATPPVPPKPEPRESRRIPYAGKDK